MELWGAVGAAGLLGALIASVATLAEAKSDSDVLIGLAVALVLFGGGGAAAGFGVLPHLLANSRAYDAARKAKGPRRPPDGQPE